MNSTYFFPRTQARDRITFGLTILLCLVTHAAVGIWHGTELRAATPSTKLIISAAINQLGSVTLILWQGLAIASLLAAVQLLIWTLSRATPERAPWHGTVAANLAWTSLAVAWLTLRANAALFPLSIWTWLFRPFDDQVAAKALDAAAVLFLVWRCYATGRAVINKFQTAPPSYFSRWGWLGAIGILCLMVSWGGAVGHVATASAGGQPPGGNIVVIGLDSMRRDIALGGQPALIPNLSHFRDHAYVEANVINPLSRTFPSWVTMLTGKHPAQSGARFNLIDQATLPRTDTLAWDLRKQGFQTIYATDETRFSNIGREFGFDKVIAPAAGVADFVLGQISDQPLLNLAGLLPNMERLLPTFVGNRAIAFAYYPASFLGRLERQLGPSNGERTFLAIHLCLAHWPYFSARSEAATSDISLRYKQSIEELDEQFGELMQRLRMLGYIDDETLVVVLADHGETISATDWTPEHTEIHDGAEPPTELLGGHGSNLLSTADRNVFVMFEGKAHGRKISPSFSRNLSSLEDLRSTLTALAGVPPTEERTMAVVSRLGLTPQRPSSARQYVKLETGFRPEHFDPLHPDPALAAQIASKNYRFSSTGKVTLRPETVAIALKDKDFGFTDGETSLAIIRVAGTNDYLMVVDRHALSQRDIYSGSQKSEAQVPFLALACNQVEILPRIRAWCSAELADTDPRN